MSVVAGADVGSATTEVVLVSGGTNVGSGRVPTRGRKGSADSLRAATALVRRLERQAGRAVIEVTGRLRVLAAGVPTPGNTGACVLLTPESPDSDDPVVALVPEHIEYEKVVGLCSALVAETVRRPCSSGSFA